MLVIENHSCSWVSKFEKVGKIKQSKCLGALPGLLPPTSSSETHLFYISGHWQSQVSSMRCWCKGSTYRIQKWFGTFQKWLAEGWDCESWSDNSLYSFTVANLCKGSASSISWIRQVEAPGRAWLSYGVTRQAPARALTSDAVLSS